MTYWIIYYPISGFIESKNSGIYEKGILFSGKKIFWEKIDKYIVLDNTIRIVPKSKGVFDITIPSNELEDIVNKLKLIGITKSD